MIESDAPEITVVAGAGSGKTTTLSARYLRLVEQGVPPSSILCVTYTRKAAAEMKTRIVRGLQDRKLYEEAQEAETGPIQTMHSLYERILRENAVAAGIDPEFEVLDPLDESALWKEAIEEAAAGGPDPESQPEEAAAHKALVDALIAQFSTWDARQGGTSLAKVEEVVHGIVGAWRLSGKTPDQVAPHPDFRTWERSVDAVVRAALPTQIGGALSGEPGMLIEDLREHRRQFPRDPMPRWAQNLLKSDGFPLDEFPLARAAHALSLDAWRRYEAELARTGRMDFAATETSAVELVEGYPAVAARLRRRFRHVMIDESQDLNPIQDRLLAAISPASRLFVGDGQQAIYGFRGADRTLFTARGGGERFALAQNRRSRPAILNFVAAAYAPIWGEEFLRMEAVLAPAAPMEMGSNEEFDPFADPPKDESHGRVLLVDASGDATVAAVKHLLSMGTPPGEIAVLAAQRAANVARALGRAGIPNKVLSGGEDFYARLEIRDLANVLGAIADPGDRLSLLAALRSPAVGLSFGSILRLADRKELPVVPDDFEPESPEDGERLDRFRSWFFGLVTLADHLPAWEILGRVLAQSDLLENLAREPHRDQAIANVRKMLALATRTPEIGLVDFARRIRAIRHTRTKEGDAALAEENANLVTVSTVHGAKGLEWEAVVYHDAGRKRRECRDVALVSAGPDGYNLPDRYDLIGLKLGRTGSRLWEALAHLREEAEENEAQRLDYVAATRAKRILAIVAREAKGTRKNSLVALAKTFPPGLYERVRLTESGVPAPDAPVN